MSIRPLLIIQLLMITSFKRPSHANFSGLLKKGTLYQYITTVQYMGLRQLRIHSSHLKQSGIAGICLILIPPLYSGTFALIDNYPSCKRIKYSHPRSKQGTLKQFSSKLLDTMLNST